MREDVQDRDAGGSEAPAQLPGALPIDKALRRFVAKCEFMPASGCVLWRGGTEWSRDKTERTGVFSFEGKRWRARRWAAVHIHKLFGKHSGKEATVSCGEALCVQHVTATDPVFPGAMFYAVREKGYAELDERKPPNHEGPPMHGCPEWARSARGEDVPF
jgi:hypothetical protein